MRKLALVIPLLGSLAFSQTAPTKTTPVVPRHRRAANLTADNTPEYLTPDVPPTAPVITLPGYCPDAPAGTDSKSPECKTVVTKAEFEKLIDVLSPKMPAQTRQNLALDYAKMIVLSREAKTKGIEQSDRFKELMRFATMQLASQELFHQLQQESKPTDEQVQKYYQDHPAKYEEISVKRIFVPRNRADATGEDKMPTDEEVKAEGEKVKARLQAGEDFDKVQKDVYTAKGYNTPPPPTSVPDWRTESVPPNQKTVLDLKQGEISPVMVEAAGAYIYRLEEKKTAPLASVKEAIESELAKQNFNSRMEALLSPIKPELNQAYFHPPVTPGAPAEGAQGPPGAPDSHQVRPMADSASTSEEPASPKK